jgi:hypothetical protein
VFVALGIAGCDDKAGQNTKHKTSSEATQQPRSQSQRLNTTTAKLKEGLPTTQSCSVWVRTWSEVASRHNILEENTKEVAELMSNTLNSRFSHVPVPSLSTLEEEHYRSSMERFIATQYERGSKRFGYWLVFCVVEAASRQTIQTARPEEIREDYRQTIKTISNTMIIPRFQKELSHSEYQQWEGEIQEAIRTFEDEIIGCIEQFQEDFLCPAFRETHRVDAETLESIGTWIAKTKHFPRYEEPDQLMVSKDKRFRHRLESFMGRGAVNLCLFNLFLGDIRPKIKHNEYWGYMEWGAVSESVVKDADKDKGLSWPLVVRMEPNQMLNKSTHY